MYTYISILESKTQDRRIWKGHMDYTTLCIGKWFIDSSATINQQAWSPSPFILRCGMLETWQHDRRSPTKHGGCPTGGLAQSPYRDPCYRQATNFTDHHKYYSSIDTGQKDLKRTHGTHYYVLENALFISSMHHCQPIVPKDIRFMRWINIK